MDREEAFDTARCMNEYVDGYDSFVMIDRWNVYDVITFRNDMPHEDRLEYVTKTGGYIVA